MFVSFNLYKVGNFIEVVETFENKCITVDSLAYSSVNSKLDIGSILENNASLRI